MKAPEPDPGLLARLEFLISKTTQKLSGAQLAILTRITLGQRVSRQILGLSGQGYNLALNKLVSRKLALRDGPHPVLHPEACAKYGIRRDEPTDVEENWLRKLTAGTIERRPTKNLYLLNADGNTASNEERGLLREQLFNAAVVMASQHGDMNQTDIRRGYRPMSMSQEAEMRALASVIQGLMEGRFSHGLPNGLGSAVSFAHGSISPAYPRVLDPHALIERVKTALRKKDDKKKARLRREEAQKAKRAKLNEPSAQEGNEAGKPPPDSGD